MRVLVVTTSWPLGGEDASGIFVKRLVEHLPSVCRTTVLVPAPEHPVAADRLSPGTVLFRYAPQRWQRLAHGPGGIPAALARHPAHALLVVPFLVSLVLHLWRLARRHDVIHANWSVTGCVAACVGWLTRRPVVTTLRGEDITRASRPGIFRALLAVCLRYNHSVVCVSEAMEDFLHREFPDARARILHVGNGVAEAFLAIRRDAQSPSPLSLLVVGSLIPRKNVGVILDALAAIPAEERPRLRVAGEGEQWQPLQARARALGIDAAVEFLGSVPPADMPALYARADAFVIASLSEGRPNVLLEAMASALPVVASSIDGVTELVTDRTSGLLFDPRSSEALAGALRTLIHDPTLRRQLGENARQSVMARGLTWQAAGERYAACYRAACGVS